MRSSQKFDNFESSVGKYKEILDIFKELNFSDADIDTVQRTLCATLALGDITFRENENNEAVIENEEYANKIAELLKVDGKKFTWALTNYCVVKKEIAVRRKHTCEEANEARDALANTLYLRVLDFVVQSINHKLSFGRAIL